jgi:hypothetical protein
MKQLDRVEIEKIRQLADFLETVPPEDFDLDGWVQRQQREPSSILFGLIQRHPGCGFAGCAMGWAAHSGIFPGLRLTHDQEDIVYGGFTGYDAVEALLGIEYSHASFFFSHTMYSVIAEPGHVARRLRRFADKIESRRAGKLKAKLSLVA